MGPDARIPVAGTFNLREVGGYAVPGGTVRHGRLFRSDGLSTLGEAGRAALGALGVRLVIDLRDDFEASAMPDDTAGLELQTLRLPVFEGSGASQGMAGVSLAALYEKILGQHSDVVVTALRAIATAGEDPVLVHCTAGKDRTGIVIALALLVAGVDRAEVVADYARTEANLRGEWLEGMLALLERYGVESTPELRVLMGGSPPEALDGALGRVEREHGSIRQYLLDSGMSAFEIEQLRAVLLAPDEG